MDLGSTRIVMHLLVHGKQRQKDLSKEVGYSKQHISKVVKTLEKLGIVRRYKENREYIIDYNSQNALIKELNKLIILTAKQQETIDLLEKKTR